MEAAWGTLQRAYHLVNYEWADARAQELPLVTRPFSLLALVGGYALFATRLGPWLMRDRKPFRLRRLLVAYNGLQIVINLYLFARVSKFWFNDYSWRCQAVDRSYAPRALEMLQLVHFYFWLKISDLLDTVFFVLRKKDQQISFLHVYHHSMMVLVGWQGLKYFPGGQVTFLGFINTFVHAVMYTYYLISALYPHTVWWKKYVTQLQLIQHFVVGLHEAQLLVYNPCGHHLYPPLMLVPQAVNIIWMFLSFYRKAYCSEISNKMARKNQ